MTTTEPRPPLTPFEGKPVLKAAVALTNAGDGLSEALRVDPAEYHQGDTGFCVIEWECTKVGFEPADRGDPGGPQVRRHTFKALAATVLDADGGSLAAQLHAAVADQRDRILRAREAEAGVQRLWPDDPSPFDSLAAIPTTPHRKDLDD